MLLRVFIQQLRKLMQTDRTRCQGGLGLTLSLERETDDRHAYASLWLEAEEMRHCPLTYSYYRTALTTN